MNANQVKLKASNDAILAGEKLVELLAPDRGERVRRLSRLLAESVCERLDSVTDCRPRTAQSFADQFTSIILNEGVEL